MASYYVNRHAEANGDHEVHKHDCPRLALADDKQFLGDFVSCYGAMAEALRLYPTANGCIDCAPHCHS
ncbi:MULTISPECIES: hypothetical protein [Oxalobacteraceae]|uniref:hypothetical protein n=1 Tax=Oxalobacteraceae TaxID=75682 RepID=UPI0010A4DA7F|nr:MULTISPECIES: hypothetical protein [Oxalobacteraceae]HJV52016.1 hypothetical protein [Noviherbaspirillum sp.]HJV79441.1 hypothetical protein [Noviherbaspirillum sp.]